MKKIAVILAIVFGTASLHAQKQEGILGQWDGVLTIQGVSLQLIFHISKAENGYMATMDSPDQGAFGIPVSTAEFDGQNLLLEVPNIGLAFNGEYMSDSIVGVFKQGGISVPMVLKPGEKSRDSLIKDGADKEVVLRTSAGDIFGSHLAIENGTKEVVALFINGSGPTDRNGNNPQMPNNSIRFLAEELFDAGIPSVRYDKRGIAQSVAAAGREEDMLFTHMVDDAKAWINHLSKEYKRVVVIGHSEGAQIGVISAIDNPKVAAVISIAGIGRKVDNVLKTQLAQQSEELLAMSEPIIESLKKGVMVQEVPNQLTSLFRLSIQPYLISWFATDPADEMARLTIPVLIVQGDTDIQVSIEDARLLKDSNPQAEMLIIPNMNHVLKECASLDQMQQLTTYTNPNLKNIPALGKGIIKFIQSLE